MAERIKGRMAVYSEAHKLLCDKLYYTSAGMKRIMSQWFEDYADIPETYIIVSPYAEHEEEPAEENQERIRLPIPYKEPEKRFGRPSAVYNNIPTYDYLKTKTGEGH